MKRCVLVVFALASVCTGSPQWNPLQGAEWNAFQLTYGTPESNTGYNDMPWTVQEATSEKKWEKIDEDKRLNVDVYSQHDDPRIMLLFDKRGNLAGLRMAFLKDDVKTKAEAGGFKFEFDYDNNPMYERGNYFGKELWHATVLLTSPSRLAAGGRKSLIRGRDNVADGIYYKGDGKWVEMSKHECTTYRYFAEGNCYPGMGTHYIYNKKGNNDDCKRRETYFALYNEGKLVGFALGGYGSFSKHPTTQSYYEDFSLVGQRRIFPNGPKCLEDFINKYGLTLMHVFLTKDARQITCPTTPWRSTNCH